MTEFLASFSRMLIMFSGVGIIGTLTSLLSNLFVGGGSPAPAEEDTPEPITTGSSDPEVAALKKESVKIHSC